MPAYDIQFEAPVAWLNQSGERVVEMQPFKTSVCTATEMDAHKSAQDYLQRYHLVSNGVAYSARVVSVTEVLPRKPILPKTSSRGISPHF